ncbi:Dickkopf N-terminal cysteine-rich domain-containing protein [Vitiosangium sp. GDMCC 1.1324]|uniref:Dickkopf N-terminal cysteine-rich domain-containing protein n=1 Tax=Vitiosangium sp. (strain GDMCC 1.1324) TaxID=2138576 RepID=UPI000D3B3F37|nr:Dickkopf N-terminal cysteine-rich domain-containing protein [Vitiosangium sp. GDMCC 1.1324]PTL75263.1 hypothetical protein DAT35_55460 [Vitiosangium sp. GDMCC 1.1324]
MTQHPRSPRLFVAVLPLLLLAMACGKSPDKTPTDETPQSTPIPPEQFAQEYAAAMCERAQACGNLAPYLVDGCKTGASMLIGPDDVKKAVDAGRLVYDADLARQCVNGIAKTRCLQDDLSDEVQALCYAAVKGTVQKGEACSFLFECAAGTCGGTTENTCPATCPDVLAEGQECSRIHGAPCDERAGLRCSGNVCVKPVDKGESCVDNLGCKSGLRCASSTNTCVPPATEGTACEEDASCAEGLYCQDGICAVRKGEGQRCSLGPDEVDPALRGAQCNDGLVCKGAGLDSEGNPLSGSCVKPSAEGGPCMDAPANNYGFSDGCLTGLSCVNGVCTLPPVSGECPASGTCRPGVAYCADDNTCQPLRPNGAACDIPPQCASRNCADGTCTPAVNYCHE